MCITLFLLLRNSQYYKIYKNWKHNPISNKGFISYSEFSFFYKFCIVCCYVVCLFFINVLIIKYISIIDWLLITKYFSHSPSSLWNSLHRSTGFMVWVFYLIEKKVNFCQMANMLTFCRLVDIFIFWKILEISGDLREISGNFFQLLW